MSEASRPSLTSLYGTGVGAAAVSPMDKRYQPLFEAIERAILKHCLSVHPMPTGGGIELAMNELARNPDRYPSDPLPQAVVQGLASFLPTADFSRMEVRTALRTVVRSIARNTRDGGPNGYIGFIRGFIKL